MFFEVLVDTPTESQTAHNGMGSAVGLQLFVEKFG